jgi:hypothetical protein
LAHGLFVHLLHADAAFHAGHGTGVSHHCGFIPASSSILKAS